MAELRLPLSGDVTQTLNPWTWFFHGVGSQVGMININLGHSGNPELERQILDDVGTYGRQIGQIGDALRVVIRHANLEGLLPDEQEAIQALLAQLDAVDRLKRKNGLRPTLADSSIEVSEVHSARGQQRPSRTR